MVDQEELQDQGKSVLLRFNIHYKFIPDEPNCGKKLKALNPYY